MKNGDRKKNLEPGISPTKRDPASREDLESGIMNLESGNKGRNRKKPDRVSPERIIQTEEVKQPAVELKPTEPAPAPTKGEEKKTEEEKSSLTWIQTGKFHPNFPALQA